MSIVLGTVEQLEAWREQVRAKRAELAEQRRAETEDRCRDSFAAFFRAGWHVVEGSRLLWGRHLQAQCDTAQAFAEGWLVAHGRGTPAMVARQRGYWALHGREMPPGACGQATPRPEGGDDDEDSDGGDPFELLVDHLVVNGGPGTLKSRIWMVYLQAWVWLHAPEAAFACTSGTDSNVTRDSRHTKQLVKSEWYRATFRIGWRVGVDSAGGINDAVEEWVNSAGGKRQSRAWLSSWSGVHVDFFLGDDPNDAAKVHSTADRELIASTYDMAMGNRLKFGSVTMMLQQHVHSDDLTSRLKLRGVDAADREAIQRAKACGTWTIDSRKDWAAFVLPVEFRPALRCTTPWGWTDWRTEVDEVLFPKQWTPAVIAHEKKRLELHPEGWESQGNQNPGSAAAGIVQRDWFRWCAIEGRPPPVNPRPTGCVARPRHGDDEAEAVYLIKRKPNGKLDLDWLVISVDPKNGSKKKTSSNVGLGVIGGKGNLRFRLDDRTKRIGFLSTIDAIKEMLRDWAPFGLTGVLIEAKAQGAAALPESLERDLAAGTLKDAEGRSIVVPIILVEGGSTAFEDRWNAALPTYRARMMHCLDGADWAPAYVDEICSVPNGTFDDRADTDAQAINHYADTGTASARFAALAKLRGVAESAARRPR